MGNVAASREISQLAFVSRSTIDPDPEIFVPEVAAIIHISAEKNFSNALRGALMFVDSYFCEVMEGDPDLLERRFESIQADDRHEDCKILSYTSIPRFSLPKVPLAFTGTFSWRALDLGGLIHTPGEISDSASGHALTDRLLEQVHTREWIPVVHHSKASRLQVLEMLTRSPVAL